MPTESCQACRFDGAQYDVLDAFGTLRAVPSIWRQLTATLPEAALLARPAPDAWSAAEHLAHTIALTKRFGVMVDALQDTPHLDVGAEPPLDQSPDTSAGVDELLRGLDDEMGRMLTAVQAMGDDDAASWAHVLVMSGRKLDAAWVLRHAVHITTHHLRDVGRGLHGLGAGAPTQHGSVVRLNSSDGGVPKAPVDACEVTDRGLVGDRQADRRNHGRPLQALCLWSLEVIEALQAEGHPIQPGSAGENVTLRGLDWPTLRPGTQLRIGDVLAEVSAYATPCARNAPWFTDRYFNRMDQDRHPGWSRVYAWVREPGPIRTGDQAVVEP